MSIININKPWVKVLKLVLYGVFGIGCAYCVSSCSLNFGA
jgi:hypothetical protein